MEINIERTHDMETVRKIMTHPRIYPHVSDDFSPKREEFQPVDNDAIWYVLAKNQNKPLALFLGFPENGVSLMVHHCILPALWGNRAVATAINAIDYLWRNSEYKRITAKIPMSNILSYRFAFSIGLQLLGFDNKSFLKNGRLEDQAIFGMSRPEGV